MKHLFKNALLACAIAGAFSASAENLDYNFDPNSNEYGLKGYVEYQDSGNAFPNFWVQLPNFNSTKPEAAADGERVFEKGSITMNVDGPNGYTFNQTFDVNLPFPAAEGHAWCGMGVLETSGTYNFTIVLTLNYVDTSKEPVVENFSGNFVIPSQEVDPSIPTIDYDIISTTEGVDFKYVINLGTNSADDVESVLVALLKGGEAFNESATYCSTALSGTIPVHFDGNDLGIWFKAQVNMKGGQSYQLKPWDKAMTLKKDVPAPALTYNITVGQFTRTGSTSGTLPYTIHAEGDLGKVDHWIVWAARAGDENMNVTVVPTNQLEGVLTLTVLPENANTQIWPKVRPVWIGGGEGDTMQTDTWADTRSAETPIYTLTASNPKASTTTSGTIDYAFDVTNGADQIEKFVVFVVRQSNANDAVQGDIEVGRIESADASGVVELTNLPESADTPIWVKGYAIDKAGNNLQEEVYPGAAQGWSGLSINTVRSEINSINSISEKQEEVVYFNLQGVKVANPEQGRIYIKVQGNKASKVLVK